MEKKTLKKLSIVNIVFLCFTATIVTLFRILQFKYFTNLEIACNNFESIDFLGLTVNSKFLSKCMVILISIYILFLIFYITKKNKYYLNYDIMQISNMKTNINILTKIFFIFLALASLVVSIAYLNSYKLELNFFIILIFVFQIFFAIYFLYLFFCFSFQKFNKKNILNVIFIVPVIWGCLRIFLTRHLLDFLFLMKVEFLLYNLKVSAITMFFFCFGRLLIGFNSKNNEKFIIFFGYSSIFFTFISVIPRIIFYFTNNLGNLSLMAQKNYIKNIDILNANNFIVMDLIILFFVILFIKKLLASNKR